MLSASSRRAGARVILLSAELFIHWDIFQSAALMVFHRLRKKSSPSQNNPSESHSSSLPISSTRGLGEQKSITCFPSNPPFSSAFQMGSNHTTAARRVLMMLQAHPTLIRAGRGMELGWWALSSFQSPQMLWGAQDKVRDHGGVCWGKCSAHFCLAFLAAGSSFSPQTRI